MLPRMLKSGARVLCLYPLWIGLGCAPKAGLASSPRKAEALRAETPGPVHLHLIGDSTLANKEASRFPETGWGEVLHRFLRSELSIINHAVNGRSSKSFYDEGRWQHVLEQLEPGDYVLIQFGHNDEKQHDPTRYAAPFTDYRANLTRYVEQTRGRGAEPLLSTPICRRKLNERGQLVATHGDYPGVVRDLAKQLDVPLIDLQDSTHSLLLELGGTRSKELFLHVPAQRFLGYPDGNQDDTHLSEGGAIQVAKLFIDDLRVQQHPLSAYFALDTAAAATPGAIALWEGTPPVWARHRGEEREQDERIFDVRTPALLPQRVESSGSRPAVLVFPGGGYERLSWVKEGTEIARWLNSLGIHAFIVKYRLAAFGAPAPLLDAQQAVRLVRARAREWGVDPTRIGVLGFSAGGHVAASLSTHSDYVPSAHELAPRGEPMREAESARPDFTLLVYPVITLRDPAAHVGSRSALLGPDPSEAALAFYSLDEQVRPTTPPTLLIHGAHDAVVSAENSRGYQRALQAAGVPSELVLYDTHEHGFGTRSGVGAAAAWPRRAAQWLEKNGWLR